MKEKLKTYKLVGVNMGDQEKSVAIGKLKQKGTFQELDEHSDYFSLDNKKTENN